MPLIPGASGRSWEPIPAAPLPAQRTNLGYWVWDRDEHESRAYFKYVNPAKPRQSSLYSLGMERVACTLGRSVGIPLPDVYLEQIGGELGVVSMRVPGNAWATIADEQFEHVEFVDRAQWTLYLVFDCWLANHDRHGENIFVEWNPPLRRRPVPGDQAALWLIDFGWAGLWPVYKFGQGLGPADLEQLHPDADLLDDFQHALRNNTPPQYRSRMALRGSDERAAAIEIVRGIADDDLERAFDDVRGTYLTTRAAELTSEFLRRRLHRLASLVDAVFPV